MVASDRAGDSNGFVAILTRFENFNCRQNRIYHAHNVSVKSVVYIVRSFCSGRYTGIGMN